jgi:hypothetical protein
MKTAKALGLDVPTSTERGRVDRIGIPQRKKTGSPTAAMGLGCVKTLLHDADRRD